MFLACSHLGTVSSQEDQVVHVEPSVRSEEQSVHPDAVDIEPTPIPTVALDTQTQRPVQEIHIKDWRLPNEEERKALTVAYLEGIQHHLSQEISKKTRE